MVRGLVILKAITKAKKITYNETFHKKYQGNS